MYSQRNCIPQLVGLRLSASVQFVPTPLVCKSDTRCLQDTLLQWALVYKLEGNSPWSDRRARQAQCSLAPLSASLNNSTTQGYLPSRNILALLDQRTKRCGV